VCYSFIPTEAAEYLDDEDVLTPEPGVLVGYKVVYRVTRKSRHASVWVGSRGDCLGVWGSHSSSIRAYRYATRQVSVDGNHGFHVLSTQKQVDEEFSQTETNRCCNWLVTSIVRVLVPRAACRPDGHVTHMMVIPPGEHETREDIEKVAAVNRELVRARTGGEVREKVNEHNPQSGETVKAEDVERQRVATT